MNSHTWTVLISMTTLLLLTSCGGSKRISGGIPSTALKSEAAVLYRAMLDGDDYTWYTGKARLKASTPYERVSANMNLRIHCDNVIWATIDKLGFEIGRVLITPDSVMVVDRLNKEYTRKSLSDFLLEYGVSIGFGDLQNALIGKMIALTPVFLETNNEEDMELLVVNDHAGVTARHWITGSLPHRLLKSFIVDASGRKLQIENVEWENYRDGTQIPYGRLLTFEDADGLTEIEIQFSEITKNVPAKIPFSIPEHYVEAR